jgi:glucokinase
MNLVFNCGGTNTRMGISADGEAIDKYSSFSTQPSFDDQLVKLKEESQKLLVGKKLDKVAGGVAGVWQKDKAKLFTSPNLPDWENVPIRKKLEELFGVRVNLANDAEMEGLGEATMGAGRRKRIMAYLTIGTGIGGVKIEDGKICPRVFGFEPGHQIIDVCGEVGYLEDFAGGAAMKKIYGQPPAKINDVEAWEKETQLIAVGIHNAILFWSPEIVVLGGGLMQKMKLADLKAKLAEQLKMLPKLPEMALAELKEKAGLYGALSTLRKPGEMVWG